MREKIMESELSSDIMETSLDTISNLKQALHSQCPDFGAPKYKANRTLTTLNRPSKMPTVSWQMRSKSKEKIEFKMVMHSPSSISLLPNSPLSSSVASVSMKGKTKVSLLQPKGF